MWSARKRRLKMKIESESVRLRGDTCTTQMEVEEAQLNQVNTSSCGGPDRFKDRAAIIFWKGTKEEVPCHRLQCVINSFSHVRHRLEGFYECLNTCIEGIFLFFFPNAKHLLCGEKEGMLPDRWIRRISLKCNFASEAPRDFEGARWWKSLRKW